MRLEHRANNGGEEERTEILVKLWYFIGDLRDSRGRRH